MQTSPSVLTSFSPTLWETGTCLASPNGSAQLPCLCSQPPEAASSAVPSPECPRGVQTPVARSECAVSRSSELSQGLYTQASRPMAATYVCSSGAPGEGRAGHGHPHLWGKFSWLPSMGCDPREHPFIKGRQSKRTSSLQIPFRLMTMSALLLCTELLGWDNGHEGHPFLSKSNIHQQLYLFVLFIQLGLLPSRCPRL